ncbi:MAG: glycosyltransferase family 2 protein, partial [Pseudomonadota bacterium]
MMSSPEPITWPKFSIITPSFNQGQFIERAIRSVLEQDYPNIEYIIIDGGSTDNTVDIIKKYSDQITYWESASDDGQPDAINKGLEHATGEIFAFINSDDYYYPNAFRAAARAFMQGDPDDPERQWVVGIGDHFDENGNRLFLWKPSPRWFVDRIMAVATNAVCQHACFWRHSLI